MLQLPLEQVFQTALQFHQAGQLSQAEPLYRQILAQNPTHARALHFLGLIAHQHGNHAIAADLIRQSLAHAPAYPSFHFNLGNVLQAQGHLDQAIAAYQQAIALDPNYAAAYSNLGQALKDRGQLDAAIAACQHAIALNPKLPEAHHNLGVALKEKGDFDGAIAAYRQALALKPNLPEAHNSLGNALKALGQLDAAIAACRQALALNPTYAEAHSNLLLNLHYLPNIDAATIAAEHRAWHLQHAAPLQHFIQPHPNDRHPDRRLRIGYVSPDFRHHPVGRFLLPLLTHHDKTQVEVFAYSQVQAPDTLTQQLQSHTDHWRTLVGLSDAHAADLIRQDAIDILIDLTGHTAHNRLLLFARKPAPVQVTYLGYPNTTGLQTIDYRLTDHHADPPGFSDTLHTEQLLRLPDTCWLYHPPAEALAMAVAPHAPHAPITFGSFNTFEKITDPTLHLWAQILAATPHSQLLLKARALSTPSLQQRLRNLFATHNISPNRLQLLSWTPTPAEHLQLYHRLTIALDPFPYHGTTITCEAFCMGVPVITLAGPTHVSRVGVSLLTTLGTPELIAHTPEEYVHIAISLANDHPRLAHLRSTFRQRLQQSPLANAPRFTRQVETAYRQIWRQWCATAS